MFEIYKFEYDCQFITREELHSYIGMGILSETEYNTIVGEDYVAPQAQPAQAQPAHA